jgi:hypothetical protein
MAWFDREHRRSEKPAPARFTDVGAPERRLPSWLAKGPPEPRRVSEKPAAPSQAAPDLSAAGGHQGSDRFRAIQEHPVSIRAASRQPSRPPSRTSMTPSELESLITERAAQRASANLMEEGRVALGEAIESLEQARRDMLYGAEQRIIELAILISRRVIARELKTQPDLVADLVREGIDSLAASDKITVQLGTGFAVAAVMISEQLASRGIDVELGVTATLPEFGCVIESDIGRVDEGIESRIDAAILAIESETEG